MICIIPYLQLQLTGIGIIVEAASFGGVGRAPAMVIAVALVTTFVFLGGIRAVAWVSILKDVLDDCRRRSRLALASPISTSAASDTCSPRSRALMQRTWSCPGQPRTLGHRWYISTVLLSALGAGMWPHNFAATFTAKNGDTLRRNAVVLPLYNLSLAFMMFAGSCGDSGYPGPQR